jgi:hypothetical protein
MRERLSCGTDNSAIRLALSAVLAVEGDNTGMSLGKATVSGSNTAAMLVCTSSCRRSKGTIAAMRRSVKKLDDVRTSPHLKVETSSPHEHQTPSHIQTFAPDSIGF